MKIKGLYVKNILEFIDCELFFEFSKFQRLKFHSRHVFKIPDPKNKVDFEIEKISSEPLDFIPNGCNYEFTYIGKNEEPQKIYLNLNQLELFRLNWNTKKYLIQSKEIKTDILKYVIGGILGFLGTIAVQKINQYNKAPEKPPKAVRKKSFEVKYKNTDFVILSNETIVI